MRVLKFIGLSVIAIGLLGAGIARGNAEPVKIRVSWTVPVANWPSLLLEKKDLAKHMGQSYVMEDVRFNGTPPMITALATGDIEIGNPPGDDHRDLYGALDGGGCCQVRSLSNEGRRDIGQVRPAAQAGIGSTRQADIAGPFGGQPL